MPIGMNSGMNSTRNNVMAVQPQAAPMNIISYSDSGVTQSMGGEGGLSGGMNSTMVAYSYITVRRGRGE